MASLEAAETLREMSGVPGNCHALRGNRRLQFALHLWGSYRLVFEPDMRPLPTTEDGGLDTGRVTAIQIVEVVDYHGR
jgi:proteic killer suppression protein